MTSHSTHIRPDISRITWITATSNNPGYRIQTGDLCAVCTFILYKVTMLYSHAQDTN